MSTSFSSDEYARLAAGDRARIASARTLLAAGRVADARTALDAVQVLMWRAEQVLEGIRGQERKAA